MKFFFAILAGLLIILLAANSYAARRQAANKASHNFETVSGKIVSIDKKTKTIIVKVDQTNKERNFIVNAKNIHALKLNEEVRVKFEAGSNITEDVKAIKKQNKMTKNKMGG